MLPMKEEVVGMFAMLRNFSGMLPFLRGKARAIFSIPGEPKKEGVLGRVKEEKERDRLASSCEKMSPNLTRLEWLARVKSDSNSLFTLGTLALGPKFAPPPLTGPFPRVGGKERSVGEGVWVAGLSPGLVNRPPS